MICSLDHSTFIKPSEALYKKALGESENQHYKSFLIKVSKKAYVVGKLKVILKNPA